MKEKRLDPASKMGRILYAMKDLAVRMKPDVRVRVIRVYNTVEGGQDDPQIRFRVREDLEKLGREPQLAGLAKRLFKELPNT